MGLIWGLFGVYLREMGFIFVKHYETPKRRK